MTQVYIHPTAAVASSAHIGEGTKIWMNVQVREDVQIGRECIIGKDTYVDFQVIIGNRCKIQNGALIYHAAELGDGVFIGPGAILTNDRVPRAVKPDGTLAGEGDWMSGRIRVFRGASVGAGAVLITGISVGEYAMVGAGAVVTHSVPPYTLVVGNPARSIGYVCRCGQRLTFHEGMWKCELDGIKYREDPTGGLIIEQDTQIDPAAQSPDADRVSSQSIKRDVVDSTGPLETL